MFVLRFTFNNISAHQRSACCLKELPHNLHSVSSTPFEGERKSVCTFDISNRLLLTDVAIIRSFNCRFLEYLYFWFRTVYLNLCVDLFGEGNWCWWSFGCDLVTFWWGLAWERRFAFLLNGSWNVVVIICACFEYCILSGFIEIHILKINKKSKFICKIWGRFER